MPKRKVGGGVSDHEDDDEEVPASKKKLNSGDADSVVACELSKNRKVVVKKFKGKVMVDIREFWSKDGEDLPSKKGISLPIEQWEVFRDHIKDVQKVIETLN